VPSDLSTAPHIPVWSLSAPAQEQHLVNVNHIERADLHLNMKAIFTTSFYHVLLGTNIGSLQGSKGKLLISI
jgi:hypothetical protein